MGTSFSALKKLLTFATYNYEEHNLEACVPKDHEGAETYALSEFDSKEEMKKYGVPVPAQAIARSTDEIKEAVKG